MVEMRSAVVVIGTTPVRLMAGWSCRGLASGTVAIDLELVARDAKLSSDAPGGLGDKTLPQRLPLPAPEAHEVVVVLRGQSVAHRPIPDVHGFNEAFTHKGLQRPVHGGEADRVRSPPHAAVEFLRGEVAACHLHGPQDRFPLPGRTPVCDHLTSAHRFTRLARIARTGHPD